MSCRQGQPCSPGAGFLPCPLSRPPAKLRAAPWPPETHSEAQTPLGSHWLVASVGLSGQDPVPIASVGLSGLRAPPSDAGCWEPVRGQSPFLPRL